MPAAPRPCSILDTTVAATPDPFLRGQSTTISFRTADALSSSCSAAVRILDASARVVRGLTKSVKCPTGGSAASVLWDGRNTARALVPPGTYTIEVVATDLAGNTSPVGRDTVIVQ